MRCMLGFVCLSSFISAVEVPPSEVGQSASTGICSCAQLSKKRRTHSFASRSASGSYPAYVSPNSGLHVQRKVQVSEMSPVPVNETKGRSVMTISCRMRCVFHGSVPTYRTTATHLNNQPPDLGTRTPRAALWGWCYGLKVLLEGRFNLRCMTLSGPARWVALVPIHIARGQLKSRAFFLDRVSGQVLVRVVADALPLAHPFPASMLPPGKHAIRTAYLTRPGGGG